MIRTQPSLKTLTAWALLLIPAATVTAQDTTTTSTTSRPNVIVILTDDMGWSDIGALGSEIRTPNIDKMAENGKLFTHFYNTARCCPSRASLLTGLYPHQAGVGHMLWPTNLPGYDTRLTSEAVTIAEALKENGYRTYMTGKWHLAERVANPADPTGWPLQRGFDEFYGTIAGYGSFYDPATLTRGNTYITPENDPRYKPDSYYYTDAISDNSVMYINEHEQQHDDKPFFMYVAFTAAHWPIQVPEDSLEEYKGKYDQGYDAIRQARIAKLKELELMPDVDVPGPTTGEWDKVKNKAYETRRMEAYAAMITRMDQGIGKMLEALEKNGELENTLILYMHDNGGCDEEFFHNRTGDPENLHVMGPDELQDQTLVPMQTRDGRKVHTGEGVMAGPDDSFIGYGPGWANVSDTPFRLVKKNAHEGGIATPLIAHWPAAMGGDNKRVDEPGHLIDLMPTILEVANASYPAEHDGHKIQPMEGKSLVPLLTGNGNFERQQPLFWEHEGSRAIRRGEWKLVSLPNTPWELYNIAKDRGEMNNLAAENLELVDELAAEWQAYADRAKVAPYGAHLLRQRQPDPENAPTRLELETGDVYTREHAPALTDVAINITADVREMAPEGTIVSQGAGAAGYTLYVKDGKVHFAVRRANELFSVSSTDEITTRGPATIKASLKRDGTATLQFNDQEPAKANFYGPLLETPAEALTVGWDQDSPVGDYPPHFSFKGLLNKVVVETSSE